MATQTQVLIASTGQRLQVEDIQQFATYVMPLAAWCPRNRCLCPAGPKTRPRSMQR